MKTTKKTSAAETLRRKVYALTASADAEAIELKAVVLRLLKHEGQNRAGREQYELEAARECIERREELPSPYPENPLDDQEALDEVRRRVFGSAPNSKSCNKQQPK